MTNRNWLSSESLTRSVLLFRQQLYCIKVLRPTLVTFTFYNDHLLQQLSSTFFFLFLFFFFFSAKMTTDDDEYQHRLTEFQSGDNSSKTKLAWFLLSGRGSAAVDEDRAVALLEERVKDKDDEAMWMLGLCNEFGRGTEQDVKRAESLYEQSQGRENRIGKYLRKRIPRGVATLRLGCLWTILLLNGRQTGTQQ